MSLSPRPGSLLTTDRSKAVILVLFLLNVFGVGVSCLVLHSFVVYLYVSRTGSITSIGEERELFVCCCLLVIMWFLFGEVSSSSGCLGYVILLWHSLSLPYNYFHYEYIDIKK